MWIVGSYLLCCARQSEPYDPGKDFIHKSLYYQLTGENLTSKPRQNTNPEVIYTVEEGNGVFRTQVKAVDFNIWTDFSFSSRSLANLEEFDIGFRRYTVRTNGGATNPNRLGAACKSNTKTFPSITTSSVSIGCTIDRFQEDRLAQAEVAGGGGVQYVGSDVISNFETGWFTYVLPSLKPTMDVFVIRSHDGQRFYAIQIINYYSDAGTSAYPTFRWAIIPFE